MPRHATARRPRRHARAAHLLLALPLLAGLAACSPRDPLQGDGRWTFVNYWAEWCKPCIREIPELNALDAQEGYRVFGVNFDGATGEALAAQEQKLGVAFPTLAADPAARFALQRPEVLPTTLVLSPTGELHRVLVGPQTAASLKAATESGPAS